MAKLRHFEDVTSLGKLLVEELRLDNSVDTLGRWMAHHVAELIHVAKTADLATKSEAEDRCREAVLSLWKHISDFKLGDGPLANADPLIAALKALDPDNTDFFYQRDAQSLLDRAKLSPDAKKWLTLSRGIDYSARMLISMSLNLAAKEISEGAEEYLDLAKALDVDIPTTRVIRFVIENDGQNLDGREEIELQDNIKALAGRKERLESMVGMSRMLANLIGQQIADLEKNQKSNS
jgi:hypothetical protein